MISSSRQGRLRRRWVSGLVTAVALVGTAALAMTGVAAAQTSTPGTSTLSPSPTPSPSPTGSVTDMRTICSDAVGRRVSALNAMASSVAQDAHVAAADQQALGAEITATVTGLNGLVVTMGADKTFPQVVADCKTVVPAYRVYLLVLPQAELVRAVGLVQASAGALTTLQSLLQTKVNTEQAAGKNVTPVQVILSDMAAKIAAAQQAAQPVDAMVEPLRPSGYPANRSVLVSARAALAAAQGDLSAALADGPGAITALQSVH